MFRSKSWFGGGLWKPKNPHSLDHLKYLYNVLSKNQTVSEGNRGLLVETLRSIAEILIWGDQNDSSVFDFFLEKNMLSFFLKIMKQKCGSYVCVQLLQTLNILFENIRNETSLYYLLSNNHVNSIIVHKFDFSDEEVMAYYISFLKTLSLKLNGHTIHFFYNEHTNDFPLYTEAIKFFNHSESMVRIAVRTLTLNVYRVEDKSMLRFIRDRTAAPYFSNLVWFIGNHVLELDSCVRNDADHQSKHRLANLVAEHLDHLHYLNDILSLNIADLNQVLTDHLLNKLLVPLYVFSLDKHISSKEGQRLHVSSVVSLFLLSQVFLILTHRPLVDTLAKIILHADQHVFSDLTSTHKIVLLQQGKASVIRPGFLPPTETLERSLESSLESPSSKAKSEKQSSNGRQSNVGTRSELKQSSFEEAGACANVDEVHLNITDEEKYFLKALECQYEEKNPRCPCVDVEASSESAVLLKPSGPVLIAQPLTKQPFIDFVYQALSCVENDYAALFALCLLFALGHNKGVGKALVHGILFPCYRPEGPCSPNLGRYNSRLVDHLLSIINLSCQPSCRVRLVTLELALRLLSQVSSHIDVVFLSEEHLAGVMEAKKESTALLRNFYKSEEILLDMFEDEYYELKRKPLNVERLTMDASVLLPPTGTPLTGIEFGKRLPSGEGERARRAIRVFLLVRNIVISFGLEKEKYLPLTDPATYVQVDDALDLDNTDVIACTVIMKDGTKLTRQFLVIDTVQIILVESAKRIGWAVAKFAGVLQDIEVTCDKDDSRSLHIVIHRPPSANSGSRVPLLSAQFIFDDHIRCIAAKQRLTKGRTKARQKKMQQIARLLEIQDWTHTSSGSPPSYNLLTARKQEFPMHCGRVPPPPPLPPSQPTNKRRRLRPSWSCHVYSSGLRTHVLFLGDSFSYCRQSSSNIPVPISYNIGTKHSLPLKTSVSCGVLRTAGLRDLPLLKSAKVPGYAAALGRESLPSSRNSNSPERVRTRDNSRSRDSSPKALRPKSEEIPLKDIQKTKDPSSGRQNAGASQKMADSPVLNSSTPCSSTMASTDLRPPRMDSRPHRSDARPPRTDLRPSRTDSQTSSAPTGASENTPQPESEQSVIPEESETSFTRRTPTHVSNHSRRRGQVETV